MVRTDGFEEDEQYQFEKILDYGQAENNRRNYLVKWAGRLEPAT